MKYHTKFCLNAQIQTLIRAIETILKCTWISNTNSGFLYKEQLVNTFASFEIATFSLPTKNRKLIINKFIYNHLV